MLIETGDLIVERLRKECATGAQSIFITEDLAGVKEADQITPARHVVLFDYQPANVVGGDGVWDEIYLVVHVVKNVAKKDGVAAKQTAAANLMRETLAALAGWKPATSTAALEVIPGPRPLYSASHAYFSLAFRARPITEGAC